MNASTPPTDQVDGEPHAALSPKEQALWLFERMYPDAGVLNVPVAFRVPRRLRWWPLHAALQHVVRRHPRLRTIFPEHDGVAVRQVLPPDDDRTFVELAVLGTTPETLAADLTQFAAQPFDVTSEPLIRAAHLTGPADGDIVCVVVQHLVFDAASAGVLVSELMELYEHLADTNRVPASLSEIVPPFVEPPSTAQSVRYWREHLAGAGTARMDLELARTGQERSDFTGERIQHTLSKAAADALAQLSTQLGATRNIILLAAYYLVLFRHGAGEDIVVGLPVDARDRAGRGAIGYHVNIVGVRMRIDGEDSVRTLVRRTRDVFLGGVMHARASIDEVFPGSYDSVTGVGHPLFRHMFNYSPLSTDLNHRYGITAIPVDNGYSRLDLTLTAVPRGDGVALDLVYSPELFERPAAATLMQRFEALLISGAQHPDRPLRTLSLWTQQDVTTIRDAHRAPPAPDPIHCGEAVIERARLAPDAPAVVDGDRSVSYAELVAIAGRLAGQLHREGVEAGDVVGVMLDVGAEFAGALLAAWLLGAAALPIGPAHERGHVHQLLRLTRTRVVVAHGVSRGFGAERIVRPLSSARPGPVDLAAPPTYAPGTGDDTACVIGTAGTGGAIRAVRITHANLAAVVPPVADRLGIGPGDGSLVQREPGTLGSILEMLLPLVRGARGVVAPPHAADDIDALRRVIRHNDVRVLPMTAPLLAASAESMLPVLDGRRVLGVGGPPPASAVRRVAATAGRLLRVYGTVETTGWAIWTALDNTARIGTPLPGGTAFVTDADGGELPPGLWGELCIAGPAVAADHVGGPGAPAHGFAHHPEHGRYHRTGVTARWRLDGTLETQAPDTDESASPPVPSPPVVAADEEHGGDQALTEMLLALWRELLDQPDLDPQAHFFRNGGTSVQAGRIVARVRTATGVRLPLRQVFAAPTPASLARHIAAAQAAGAGGPGQDATTSASR